MLVTVIHMYRGHDAEVFTYVVQGVLTPAQRDKWRETHKCDDHFVGHEDDQNEMCFCEIGAAKSQEPADLRGFDYK